MGILLSISGERSRHQSEYAFLQPRDAFKLQMTNGERGEGEERRVRWRRHGRQGLLQLYEELHAERGSKARRHSIAALKCGVFSGYNDNILSHQLPTRRFIILSQGVARYVTLTDYPFKPQTSAF